MTTYVYGGNFEGIQSYIYGTDKLKEIVGASELLNEICSEELFDANNVKLREEFGFDLTFCGKFGIVQAAASKLRIVFEKKDDCKKMMKEFPEIVRNAVPGIEFSQADEEQETEDLNTIIPAAKKKLEEKLAAEKNKPSTLYYPNLMIVKRANRTGLPITGKSDDPDEKWLDEANIKKRKMADYSQERNAHKTLTNKVFFGNDKKNIQEDFLSKHSLPVEIGKISNENSFIAVVHADGNGLGNLIQKMDKTPLKEFSKSLDDCTVNSAKEAFSEVVKNCGVDEKNNKELYPFRPIILGGDDFTFVCKADDAVEMTKRFIQIFEEKSAKDVNLNKNGGKLTVCAGIAFVKENYPMHFAYDLAESLCDLAKDKAKKLQRKKKLDVIPSCFAFRKELGSFAEDFENIKEKNKEFVFGPYAVSESGDELPQIDTLVEVVKVLEDNNPFKSFLRSWMSEEISNPDSAKLLRDRFRQVADEKYSKEYKRLVAAMEKLVPQEDGKIVLQATKDENKKSPVLDILTLISVAEKPKKETQEEKGGENDNN